MKLNLSLKINKKVKKGRCVMSENYINPFKQYATNNQKENEERKEIAF